MKTGIGGILGAAAGCVLLLLSGCATTTAVADEPAEAAVVDRAARLSYLEGDVRVALEGGSTWAEPRLNLTLTGGDRLRTARDSRAELGWNGGALRLDGGSEVELDRLTDGQVRVWLEYGVAALSVRSLDEGENVAIATGAGVVNVLRAGDYRVEADDRDGDTLVIVRSGLAEFDVNGRYYRVRAGEMLRMHAGDADSMRVSTAFAEDGFDRWCSEREDRLERSAASRYVSPDIVGYEDLDAYGSWEYAPGYGNVWFPSGVGSGWTPYAFGSWVWVSPWGWTWLDSSPWGYAPYHYGTWARYHNRWGWVPGQRHERPRYAPAPEGWRHERPLQTGDGHVYRPPPPPREAPPRTQHSRDDTRVTIPERPVHAAPRTPTQPQTPAQPQPPAQPQAPTQHREPTYDNRTPRNGGRGGDTAAPGATAPAVTPMPTPSQPQSERPQNGRSGPSEQRREREPQPQTQRERTLQTREPAPTQHTAPQPAVRPATPAPAATSAPPATRAPRWISAPQPTPAPAQRQVTPAPVQATPAAQRAPQQSQPTPRRQHEDQGRVERDSDPHR